MAQILRLIKLIFRDVGHTKILDKDFGQGFYLTTIQEQAEKMAKRMSRIYGGTPCVTIFEFDEAALCDNNLNCRIFETPSKE